MDINHTEITQKRREVRVSDGRESIEIVEENVEVISVAAAELRKVEEVAAAQAQAIAGTRGEDPVSEAFVESEDAGADEADTSGGEEAVAEATGPEAGETAAGGEEADSVGTDSEEAETEESGSEESESEEAETEESGSEEAETEKAGSEEADSEAESAGPGETASDAADEAETAEAGESRPVTSAKPADSDSEATVRVIGVRFRNAVKVFYFNPGEWVVRHGNHVIVETVRGIEYGTVVGFPMNIKVSKLAQPLKDVIRVATPEDDEIERRNRAKEREAYHICQEKIQAHGLEMKLINAEYTFDNSKVLFYFTADGRVDFRDLVKDLASVFRTRIELRQIGVRDETKILGGYGICGRPLCCHTWMSEFIPVSIKMAKEQNLSLNPGKISGVCGRLMCCLKNEAETYEELNRSLPKVGDEVQGKDGLSGQVESVNVLRQTVRILVEVDDEKEYHEYHVDDLTILRRRRRGGNRARKDNIDSKEAQELEKLESQERQSQNPRERGDRPGRGNRQNRGDNQDRTDRQNRGDNQDRSDRQNRGDNQDRADRQNRGNRQYRGDNQNRRDNQDRGDNQNRRDNQDRGDNQNRRDNQDRGDNQNRRDNQDRGDNQNRRDNQDRGDAQGRRDNQDRGDAQGRGDYQDRGNRRYNRRRNPNYQSGGQGQAGSGSNGSGSGTAE